MNWNSYVIRRKINVEQWLESKRINDRDSFLREVRLLGLEAPQELELTQMFPPAAPQQNDEVKNESASVTSERSDQVTTRGMAGERDGTDKRSDRKRASKVRN